MWERGGPGFKYQLHYLLTGRFGTSYFIPQCLHFLIHKMGTLIHNNSLMGLIEQLNEFTHIKHLGKCQA